MKVYYKSILFVISLNAKWTKQSKQYNSIHLRNIRTKLKNHQKRLPKNSLPKVRYEVPSPEHSVNNVKTNTDIIGKILFLSSPSINNYFSFCESIKKVTEPDSDFFRKRTTNTLKINLSTTNSFRADIEFLKVDFYTNQLKEENPYRVIIRNLHLSTTVYFIKEELNQNGFLVRGVTNAMAILTFLILVKKSRDLLTKCSHCSGSYFMLNY